MAVRSDGSIALELMALLFFVLAVGDLVADPTDCFLCSLSSAFLSPSAIALMIRRMICCWLWLPFSFQVAVGDGDLAWMLFFFSSPNSELIIRSTKTRIETGIILAVGKGLD